MTLSCRAEQVDGNGFRGNGGIYGRCFLSGGPRGEHGVTATGHSEGHMALPAPARLPGGSECQLNIHGQEQTLGCSRLRSSKRKEMSESAPNA